MSKKLYDNVVIDGHNMVMKALFVGGNPSLDKGLFMFSKMVGSTLERNNCKMSDLVFTWDRKMGKGVSFRKTLTNFEYKGNRKTDDAIGEILNELYPVIESMVKFAGAVSLYPHNLEADDVIAHYALSPKNKGKSLLIISSDKDLYQLIGNGNTNVEIYTSSGKINLINESNFEDVVTVSPENYLTFKAMVGDTSDNIKGVAGYGVKRSKTFVENFDQEKYKLSPSDIDIIKKNRKLMNVKKGFIWQNNEAAFLDKQLQEFNPKEDQHELRVILRTHKLEDHWQILKKTELSAADIADVVDNIMMEL